MILIVGIHAIHRGIPHCVTDLQPLLVLGDGPEEADSQWVGTPILDGEELVRFVSPPLDGLVVEGVKQRHLWVRVQRVQGMT